jgi:hypothetical protein
LSRSFDRSRQPAWWVVAFPLVVATFAHPAPAVMDINDRGPVLSAGRFALRITNIGVLGNAFFNNGLSFDPSFEFPRGSGYELLNRAELWVGARDVQGRLRCSGGPMLEWRPTLHPDDRVRTANAGDPGAHSYADDDGDGRIDEERLDGRDNDGDGRVDEDFLLSAQQMLTADYTDDQKEAVEYYYPIGERHVPLGLAVHQRAYTWAQFGHEDVAGLDFTITNKGSETLYDVRLGFYADLDARTRNGTAEHLDDRASRVPFSVVIDTHLDTLGSAAFGYEQTCVVSIAGEAAMVRDASVASEAPAVAILPLSHTTDPLAWFVNDAFPGVREAHAQARAPRRDSTFRIQFFVPDAPPGQGGLPLVDSDRYAALAGEYPTAGLENPRDYAVLVSCGPFVRLEPGQSLDFSLALIALADPDSAAPQAFETAMLYRGQRLDLQPNPSPRGSTSQGETGWNGHEICYSPPPGIVFDYDPHCPEKFRDGIASGILRPLNPRSLPPSGTAQVTYGTGPCVWTDLDCNFCTGDDGVDTIRHWDLDTRLPPSPVMRAVPGDHSVRIEWDNSPELAIASGVVGSSRFHFAGYKLYRLDDWTRQSLLPAPERWQRIAVYRVDPSLGGLPLVSITDVSLPPDGSGPGGSHYPIGRYRVEDSQTLNGFDYHYVVTTILRGRPAGSDLNLPPVEYESPFFASFEDRVVPRTVASPRSGGVWVVPNPYRERAAWERQPVPGDVFTRHIDFMGLPKARCRIRIYTLAGDLVRTIDHDASGGDGQAAWDLISRNGQDVESGVYLFTVESALGHQVGRFVILR